MITDLEVNWSRNCCPEQRINFITRKKKLHQGLAQIVDGYPNTTDCSAMFKVIAHDSYCYKKRTKNNLNENRKRELLNEKNENCLSLLEKQQPVGSSAFVFGSHRKDVEFNNQFLKGSQASAHICSAQTITWQWPDRHASLKLAVQLSFKYYLVWSTELACSFLYKLPGEKNKGS